MQNPDAAEYEVYDALYELETSSEDNYVYLFSYSEDAGDFCVAGWLWSASLDRSIDAAGVVYEDAYCGS